MRVRAVVPVIVDTIENSSSPVEVSAGPDPPPPKLPTRIGRIRTQNGRSAAAGGRDVDVVDDAGAVDDETAANAWRSDTNEDDGCSPEAAVEGEEGRDNDGMTARAAATTGRMDGNE
eukprot:scaffold70768_cov52-Cyclotella_meneghiniana.AAC.5